MAAKAGGALLSGLVLLLGLLRVDLHGWTWAGRNAVLDGDKARANLGQGTVAVGRWGQMAVGATAVW